MNEKFDTISLCTRAVSVSRLATMLGHTINDATVCSNAYNKAYEEWKKICLPTPTTIVSKSDKKIELKIRKEKKIIEDVSEQYRENLQSLICGYMVCKDEMATEVTAINKHCFISALVSAETLEHDSQLCMNKIHNKINELEKSIAKLRKIRAPKSASMSVS
jgi:hypothetical protein